MYFGARAHSVRDVVFLAEADFDFAEIDWKDPNAARTALGELGQLREEYGIAYLAHGPNEGNPFDLAEIVELLEPRVRELLMLAPELGITLYTQHLWLDPRFVSHEVIAGKLDLLERWVKAATQAGVTLCIENLSEWAEHLRGAFDRLPHLRMTLDVGHGEILSRTNASFGLIASFSDRIRHVHLHDNKGGSRVQDDLHLPIGAGSIDFAGILRALCSKGYDGGLSFEVGFEHVTSCREAVRTMLKAGSYRELSE
jgi:sugar phosphate isomerase/epimerase